jgi:acyl-coenzyme A synthetase/AMP-(fatty) acid ligase
MVQEVLDYGPGDSTLAVLRSSFLFCQWDVLLTLGTGGSVRLVERFEPQILCDALARQRVDRVAMVPTMLRRLLSLLEDGGVRAALATAGSPAQIVVGGELLAAETGRRYRSLVPHGGIAVIYGLTETSAPDFILPAAEYDEHAETVGRPLSGVQWRLADGADSRPPGQRGVLAVRSAGVMRGYLGEPELTRQAVSDGYFTTGDTVEVRPHGRIVVLGRGGAMVVKGANKIAPAEVESVLEQHPAVTSAFVCGMPDAILGQRLYAAVAVGENGGWDEAALRRWISQRVERYKVPDVIRVCGSLPTGTTGKLDRAELTAWMRSDESDAEGPAL